MAANGIQIIKELYYDLIPFNREGCEALSPADAQAKINMVKHALSYAPGMDNLGANHWECLNKACDTGNLYSVRLVINAIYPAYNHLDKLYNYPIGIDAFNAIRYSARGKRIFSSIFG